MKRAITILSLFFLTLSFSACSSESSLVTNVNIAANAGETSASPAAGTPTAAEGESRDATAENLVADLYKQHGGKKSPFFQSKNRSLVDKYFTKQFADLIWKDAVDSRGEVGMIGADPLYNAQDTGIKGFAIGTSTVKGETAIVPVTFTNFGKKVSVNFSLKQQGGVWKIDDILYDGGDSLRKWLAGSSTAENVSPSGEFEGKFQVGDTTCTVKPVKMAFEVRWAKGKGVEMFFAKDGYTFESDDKGGPNRFEFDDETYSTGVFYRADGKEFPVKRAR